MLKGSGVCETSEVPAGSERSGVAQARVKIRGVGQDDKARRQYRVSDRTQAIG